MLMQVEGLVTGYGLGDVLQGISLTVASGEIVSVIGANGAGKTTLMRCLSGLLPAQSGKITFAGKDLTRTPSHERVAAGIVQVPQGRLLFGPMTVRENLQMGRYSQLGHVTQAELRRREERVFQLFPKLHQRLNQHSASLSGGEQQMLAIGRALMAAPKLLLLDEPSLGLAPIVVEEIFSVIERLHLEGVTVLLVEQNAVLSLNISQRAYLMETGRIVLSGPSRSLLNEDQIRIAYLGQAPATAQ